MAEVNKPNTEPEQHDLGVRLDESKGAPSAEKLSPDIYEKANRHLAPTEVPGHQKDVFNVTRVFADDAVEMGTIVSDKKRRRSSLLKNLKSAFNEWWGKTRGSFEHPAETSRENSSVEASEKKRRPETKKEALKYATLPPQSEQHAALEKSKTFLKDVQRAKGVPYHIKNVPDKKPAWKTEGEHVAQNPSKFGEHDAANIETPDLRETMVAPIIGKHITRNAPLSERRGTVPLPRKNIPSSAEVVETPHEDTKGVVEKAIVPPLQKRSHEIKPAPVSVFPDVQKHHAPVVPTPAEEVSQQEDVRGERSVSRMPETPTQREEQKISPQEVATTVREARERLASQHAFAAPQPVPSARSAEELEQIEPRPERPAPPAYQSKPASKGRPALYILGFALIVGLVVVLIVYAILTFDIFKQGGASDGDVPLATEPVVAPAFFAPDTQRPIVVSGTAREFLSTLRESVATAPLGVTQFYPTEQTEAGERILSAREIFEPISTRIPRNLLYTLNETSMFGSVTTEENKPFIVFRSYNFDVLFAGLLSWERSMYEDLEPLFGGGGTLDAPSTSFTDAVRNNASIRILYDARGEEILLYAIVNRNTVIITNSTEALARIIERL